MPSTWLDFWQQENEFDNSMSANYAYFLDRVEQYAPLNKTLRVLDIGSGPANLEDAWHDRVGELHGLDISQRYNEIARAKHASHPNVFFHDIPADDYLNFDVVAGKQFDLIIVMSVVQYYRNAGEVEKLLANIKSLAAPGAKALVCDLIVEEGVLGDVLSILGRSLRQGKLLSMLNLLFRLRFSAYYKIRQDNGFLIVPKSEWLAMCKRLNLNARFVDEPITMQQERQNLLIQF
ncbi:class I SAM-dependent methyltransferase [Spirosoma rhododendri]|uniref:Methyltransferase domain-containing protein n=1 Tax=Spirosoma rhododendri TaxID=2728024 RepID=A0A7L5DMI8_9BACT|nr:methyltransferase domain-containing protein [Spirosoma rhododendri]QJD79694.1 methyltransferase domain-containing protein [Spirosoma rhododendri]